MTDTNQKIDPNAMHNPSTNLLVRNPTRVAVSNDAEDQRAIVDAIKGARVPRMKAIYDYSDRSRIPGLPGILKIRELDEANMLGLCMSLTRCHPNIIGIELKLGNYERVKRYTGSKINKLNFNRPKAPTEVAKDIADLLSTHGANIIEFTYKINNIKPGEFEVISSAVSTTDEEYNDNSKFCPYLEIEYFTI